ncbi:cytochrome b [Neptuniibacter sp. QD37_6]|uniref:cytochrome b n=1 Tax=Neptuniibacter sp. QD37_6 TaxID=3398210 RepID=UPI0039F44A1E
MPFNRKILNDNDSYGWGPVLLHWFIALSVIGLYPLGLYIESLSYYDPEYRTVPIWHKSIGILLAGLLITRILWRLFNRSPKALPQPKKMAIAAKAAHVLLEFLLLLTLFSGYLISTADGRAIEVFTWFSIPALPFAMEQQEDIAGEIHFLIATTLIVLAALHAFAAIKHHYIDKDLTLKRMLALREEH